MSISIHPSHSMANQSFSSFHGKELNPPSNKFFRCLAFVMLLFILFSSSLSQAQTTWYVANAGNDGINTGTSAGSPFATIGHAIAVAVSGDAIFAAAGTYDEDIDISKSISVRGAGWSTTSIRGIIGGNTSTIRITANNVEIAGFTITRIGNNTTDWNNSGLNSVGIAIQGTTISGALIRDNFITGNRSGIDINNSSTHTIRNNDINFNRTGLIFRNQTDNLTILENNISDNWTAGILFLDASSGTNVPVQTALNAEIHNNNISGNWYGQIVDRQSGGSLPAPGSNLKNFTCNWYGTASPSVTTANSAEPGYAAQIPVAYGGSATNPGGQPDIAGAASANITYSPLILSGTDVNVETTPGRGTNGFQPVAGCIISCALSGPVHNVNTGNNYCTIQAAVNDPATMNGHIINIDAGTYDEQVLINKQLTIRRSGITKPVIKFTGTPSLISARLTLFEITAANVTIEGLDFEVNLTKLGSAIVASSGTLNNLTVKDNDINPYRSGPATTAYGVRNAININYGAFRVNSVNPVVNIQGNTIKYNIGVDLIVGNADDAAFRDGIATDEGVGTYASNTIQAISQDIESRFSGPGAITVTSNSFNGGGVALQSFNSGTGNINVTGNTFNGNIGSIYTSSLRLVDNTANKFTTVSGNIFTGHNWGISLENYKNVLIDNNSFTPFPNSTSYHHITVDTKVIATSSSVTVQTAIDATIINNTFNGSGLFGGTALSFYNHDNDNAAFGSFVIGSPSNENNFNTDIANFILLDNQSGS
ncbi:MAG: right-handed parallel beta-helix repeat-containing protein, partial [Ferruginibacter sp.]